MSIFLQELIRTALIVIAGGYLMASARPIFTVIAPTKGRLQRFPFAWRYILLFIGSHFFYFFIDRLINDVIHLSAYGFIQILYFLGTILLVPFYYSLVSRRLKDIHLPGYIALFWIFFLIFGHRYAVVSSVHFFYVVIQTIGTAALFLLPTIRSRKVFKRMNA